MTNEQKKAIRKAAMKKIGYGTKKKNLGDAFSNNKNNIRDLIKNSRLINKSNMDKVLVSVDLYHKVYKDLETIISGIDRSNGKASIKKIIKNVIEKHLSDRLGSVVSRIDDIKEELEDLGKKADIDIYKLKDKIILDAKNRIYNDIMDKAEWIYNSAFIPIRKSRLKKGSSETEIKKALSKTDIENWLRKKDSAKKLRSFTTKLTSAAKVINEVSKVIKRTEKVIKVFDSYAEGIDLINQSNNLTKPEDYKEYYYKVAQKASKMASAFKSLSDKLPPGMRAYYEFIFTVAENTDKMAKVVYDYTGRLETAIKQLEKDVRKSQESRKVQAGDYSNLKENKNTNAATAGELVDVFYGGKRRKR